MKAGVGHIFGKANEIKIKNTNMKKIVDKLNVTYKNDSERQENVHFIS